MSGTRPNKLEKLPLQTYPAFVNRIPAGTPTNVNAPPANFNKGDKFSLQNFPKALFPI
jgi:hypothetical protein